MYFSYEYDDLLRTVSVHANFNGTAVEPIRLDYAQLSGRISRVSKAVFKHDHRKREIVHPAVC